MGEVFTNLQISIASAAAAISRHTKTDATKLASMSGPVSVFLSTNSLSQAAEEVKNEGALHLEVCIDNGSFRISQVWSTGNNLQFTVKHHIQALVDIIELCYLNSNASIEDCLRPTTSDLDEIWRWNHLLPPSYKFCMHEMISERAQESPDKVVISSWDGDLTYSQIEQYSTLLACRLSALGVGLFDVIPLCFEKSRWTMVAVLGVMKTGAAFVLMDPTLPLARLQNMGEQVQAKTLLSSRSQENLAATIIPGSEPLVVEADAFTGASKSGSEPELPTVPSSALMYIIFTSGSTGTPKGVQISHETYTSSAIPRAKAVGYNESSRVLDFASYAFDVSIDSMLLTLGNGGCLCIPSDEDRLNDINGAIRRMNINYAGLTPSLARILDADVIASLDGLGLGGEAVSARDATIWGQDTRIIIGYGPCECTIGCTVNSNAATGRDYLSIGPGNGAVIWIVDPDNHETLLPVGTVGELLVEGPIVGQGYLNDPEKTATAFIEDPGWLVSGHGDYPGRSGRLYKTGDLGRYDPDGSGGIVFAGRKDTQVKLRGQRVELGEIESQLRARLPDGSGVVVEIILPQSTGGQPILVAFIAFAATQDTTPTDLKYIELPDELRRTLSEVSSDLAKVMPRYMVPTAYIPINHIPILISLKTDRKQLRQFGVQVDLRELDHDTPSAERQLSPLELRLRLAWSDILKLDPEEIHINDDFFALGGDSLAAMKLVSVCRIQGLRITVLNTFDHPTLVAMADIIQLSDLETRVEIPPFSTISRTVHSACLEASKVCESDPAAVEDIYPCTASQESLFTFSLKSINVYVAQRVACIPSHIGVDDLKKAWESVVAATPILRTRLAQLQEPGLQQIVLREKIHWKHSTNLTQYLDADCVEKMELGQSLARYAIIDDADDDKQYMVWTVHHVLYDGWSEPLVLKQVSDALRDPCSGVQARMRDFVEYVRETDEIAMQDYWRRELHGAIGPQFPSLPFRDYMPTPDAMLEEVIPLDTSTGTSFTTATIIRAAWGLVASQYTGSDDVVFGETLTGRDISLPGVENIVGPLIATVPVRIRIHRLSSVKSYLQSVQQGMLDRIPYQHMGMQNIRKVSRDAQYACEAGTGLVIQPEPEYVGTDLGFREGDAVREALQFNPYPLMLAFGIQKGGFRVCASFDSSLIGIAQMKRIFSQLGMACAQLTKDPSRKVDEISCLPAADLNQIWTWNRTAPLTMDQSSKKLRVVADTKQGSTYPRALVPWVCDPRNPLFLSPIGCIGELWLEGSIIPGNTLEAPPWLEAGADVCAGRSGRVQPTGDLVLLREDGSLTFIRRKEDVLPIGGHSVDIGLLESHTSKHMPPETWTGAVVYQPHDTGLGPELAVFIKSPRAVDGDYVELLSAEHDIVYAGPNQEGFETFVCPRIPISIIMATKRLDKFIRDSLPSYMVPSAYFVVDNLPLTTGQVDHRILTDLASKIPRHVLSTYRDALTEAWTKASAHTNLTSSEHILRSAWSNILAIKAEHIEDDDNFFRLGGDSVLAMKLVSSLRAQGHTLTVADIFSHMRLADAARVMKTNHAPAATLQPYKPFSMLGDVDVELFLSEIVRPMLVNPQWSIQDVAPVTDSQALDIQGTIQVPRTSIQYTMLYFDEAIDKSLLLSACDNLIKTHDILRTVFIKANSAFHQVILHELDVPVVELHAGNNLKESVNEFCNTAIESELTLGSSFLKMAHIESTNGQHCLVIGLSHAQYDGISLPNLLRDLATLYAGEKITSVESYSTHIARIRDESSQMKAVAYWRDLLDGSSLSVIEGSLVQPADRGVFKTRIIDVSQRPKEITSANLLTAAWALVLARRLQESDVTFGSITSGRYIDSADVDNVMGPCYQFTPVRVRFDPKWTTIDLLHFVQNQAARSAAFDFLGFKKISEDCTQWSAGPAFFDSIVHHQDVEEFDAMPFAGGSCGVAISNPHGDAAYPLKAVSFLRNGQMWVGFVGSEQNTVLNDALLEELAAAVEELAAPPSEERLNVIQAP